MGGGTACRPQNAVQCRGQLPGRLRPPRHQQRQRAVHGDWAGRLARPAPGYSALREGSDGAGTPSDGRGRARARGRAGPRLLRRSRGAVVVPLRRAASRVCGGSSTPGCGNCSPRTRCGPPTIARPPRCGPRRIAGGRRSARTSPCPAGCCAPGSSRGCRWWCGGSSEWSAAIPSTRRTGTSPCSGPTPVVRERDWAPASLTSRSGPVRRRRDRRLPGVLQRAQQRLLRAARLSRHR